MKISYGEINLHPTFFGTAQNIEMEIFFYYDVVNSALTIKDRCNHSGVNTFHVILVLSLKFLFGAHKKNKYVQCYK